MKLLLLTLVLAGAGLGQADAPVRISVSIWKRDVVLYEPILVRIEVRNDSAEPVSVAPPWPWRGLAFGLWREDGERLTNPRPCEGLAGSDPYGLGWFAPTACGPSTRGRVPNALLVLGPGESMSAWMDLLQWYPVGQTGPYHLVFEWEAGEERTRPAPGKPDLPPWTGHLTADAGWITVREPDSADADAAQLLEEQFATDGVALSSCHMTSAWNCDVLVRRWPDSVYARYARYARLLAGCDPLWVPRELSRSEPPRTTPADAAAFGALYPDYPQELFPDLAGPYLSWVGGLGPVDAARARVRRARAEGRTADLPALEAEYQRQRTADPEAPARRQALLDAAWATRDFLVYEWFAARVCDTEPWAYPEVFPNGANPR